MPKHIVLRNNLVDEIVARDGTLAKDAMRLNCYLEGIQSGFVETVKRPGLVQDTDCGVASEGRGIYEWRGNLYQVVANTIYKNGSSIGTISTSTGRVYFTELDTGTAYLIVSTPSNTYYINTSDTITAISDGDFPATIVPGVVSLDGYLFVMDANGDIYNSANGDPSTWGATDFKNAELEGDPGVSLAKHLNYLIAFGEWTTEVFYDAANATGSPLNRIDSAVIKYGIAAKYSMANMNNVLVWVATDRNYGKSVMMLNGLTPTKISTKGIERIIEKDGNNISNAYAFAVSIDGHSFYVLTLPNSAITLVYDLVDEVWSTWDSDNGTSQTYFTGMYSAHVANKCLIQDEDNGKVYEFDPDTYQDDGNDINVKIVTNRFDGGDMSNKFHHKLEVVSNKPGASSDMGIRYTDDDYQTWSTIQNVDLNQRATLFALGSFQRRAFELTYADNYPLRVAGLENTLTGGDVVEGANT